MDKKYSALDANIQEISLFIDMEKESIIENSSIIYKLR